MKKWLIYPILALTWAPLLMMGGCAEIPITTGQVEPKESADVQKLAENIDLLARRISAFEYRLSSLEKDIELSAQREGRSEARLKELEAKLTFAKPRVTTPPATRATTTVPFQEMGQEKLYSNAYKEYLSTNYQGAIQGFSNFLSKYPQSRLTDNALYWLAESYFMLKEMPKAMDYLNRVVQDYPNSNRAPYALYRLGLIYDKLGDRTSAESHFRRLIEFYPTSEPAKMAAEKAESLKGYRGKEGG